MENHQEVLWLHMDDLQSRNIPEAKFPEDYYLQTWQDGCEEQWFNVVKETFDESFLERMSVDNFRDRYFNKSQPSKGGFFLVKHNNQYVATATGWEESCEVSTSTGRLYWLAVLPEHRGKGIGRALCLRVMKFLQEQLKADMIIKTEIDRENAIQLYERLGFNKGLKKDDSPTISIGNNNISH